MKKTIATLCVLTAGSIGAQQVRLLSAPDARTKTVLGNPVSVRHLPNGRLLVNDTERRQVLLLDASMAESGVVIDSAGGAINAYGPRPGGMIPYLADSTLFIDPTGLSMFVIDPTGKVARIASIPRSQDAPSLTSSGSGWPGLDGSGRLVYRGALNPQRAMNGSMTMGQSPDSLEVVRLNIATRKLDTAGFIKIQKVKINVTQTEKGMSVAAELNPVQTVDDWAVLADGSIALVRGLDYHVDLIAPNGARTSAPKISFEWKSLSDEEKVSLLDSLKRSVDRGGATGGGGPPAAMGHAAPGGGGAGNHTISSLTFAPASELPDYMPPFNQASSRGDADGNLWVRTTAKRAGAIGGPIYDVIDKNGKLIDRMQVPAGRQVVGFGPGGVVYLVGSDERGDWIERTRRN